MIVVVPMAGRSARFAARGYAHPKWMSRVFGRTILELSLFSAPAADEYVFVVRRDHLQAYDVADVLGECVGGRYRVVPVGETAGQAETIHLAREGLLGREVCVLNCDNIVVSDLAAWRGHAAQALPCVDTRVTPMPAPEQMSYAALDADGFVTRTAEKQVISSWVVAGVFYFRDFAAYEDAYARLVRDDVRVGGEYYVAPLFNYLDGTKCIPVERFVDLGTPENVARFVAEAQAAPERFDFLTARGIDLAADPGDWPVPGPARTGFGA